MDQAGVDTSSLTIAYYNKGTELEYLRRPSQAQHFFEKAYENAKKSDSNYLENFIKKIVSKNRVRLRSQQSSVTNQKKVVHKRDISLPDFDPTRSANQSMLSNSRK